MRCIAAAVFAFVSCSLCGFPAAGAGEGVNWGRWRHFAVQEGGRHKPLDTLAWESLRTLANRSYAVHPETRQKLDATGFYLAILFDWQGWDAVTKPLVAGRAPSRASYFQLHQPDAWDRLPLFPIDYVPLRKALGLSPGEKRVSSLTLSTAKIKLPKGEEEQPFVRWAETLASRDADELSEFEKRALELANRYWSYQDHRTGNRLGLVPIAQRSGGEWWSFAELLTKKFDGTNDPRGELRHVQELLKQARAAYRANSSRDFSTATTSLVFMLRRLGPLQGDYPRPWVINLEVFYNHFAPFRHAWILTLTSFLAILSHFGTQWRWLRGAAWITFAAGMAAMVAGFGIRVAVSGRAPVTNMYESLLYVSLAAVVLGMAFEWVYRRGHLMAAAAAIATLGLILADQFPAVLDSSLKPLQPVLRNNFWLITHVLVITLSYAAFALAWGLGNITLGHFLLRSQNLPVMGALTNLTYRILQVGVLLLGAGTILGGVWADYAWGRFWGWDPKEVWALISLLGYLAVLHARSVGWVRSCGLAVLSVACFSLVVMAWYGVNFVLGAGLHSYGFGAGGQAYVVSAVALQLAYAATAALRSDCEEATSLRAGTQSDRIPRAA